MDAGLGILVRGTGDAARRTTPLPGAFSQTAAVTAPDILIRRQVLEQREFESSVGREISIAVTSSILNCERWVP
jgi:hypothetical protein